MFNARRVGQSPVSGVVPREACANFGAARVRIEIFCMLYLCLDAGRDHGRALVCSCTQRGHKCAERDLRKSLQEFGFEMMSHTCPKKEPARGLSRLAAFIY